MNVLGIETTCDETAISVVRGGTEILSNVISSQAKIHEQYGGVYPEIASRQHVELLIPTIDQALKEAGLQKGEIDLIAVAKGPGLIGPLLIGLNGAKALSMAWDVPFVGVNHVEAHLYGAMMANQMFTFPALGVVISGGHTFLTRIYDVGSYEMIGTTVDDAIGEAFDKVASLLDLPYPGGPEVEKLALEGDPEKFPFKAGRVKGEAWDFSFSGLKTNVLYAVKGQNGDKKGTTIISEKEKADVAASFQEVALKDVCDKALRAAREFNCKAIYVGGGVSQNQRLRQMFQEKEPPCPIYWPSRELCLDNGAMIAGLGFHKYQGKGDPLDLEPETRMKLDCFSEAAGSPECAPSSSI